MLCNVWEGQTRDCGVLSDQRFVLGTRACSLMGPEVFVTGFGESLPAGPSRRAGSPSPWDGWIATHTSCSLAAVPSQLWLGTEVRGAPDPVPPL